MAFGNGDNERMIMLGTLPWAEVGAEGAEFTVPVKGRPHTGMQGPVRKMLDRTVEVLMGEVPENLTGFERAQQDYDGWADPQLGSQMYQSGGDYQR